MLQFTNGSPKIMLNWTKGNLTPLLRLILNSKGLYTSLARKSLKCPQWQQTLIPLLGRLTVSLLDNDIMGKASSVMYEQAMRLHLESDSFGAMKKRCSCLLACINSLHLINPRYRWIAKPVIGDEYASNSMANENMEVDEANGKERARKLLQTESLVILSEHRKHLRTFLKTDDFQMWQELLINNYWIWDAEFSADSKYLFTASSDGISRLWKLETKNAERKYTA